MLLVHCVNSDQSLAELVQKVGEGKVDFELNILLNGEILCEVLQVLNQLPVLLVPATADNDQLHLGPLFLSYYLPEFKHGLDLQRMIFLRSELPDA